MIHTKQMRRLSVVKADVLAAASTVVLAYGNVVPQPVEAEGLKPLTEDEWLTENPLSREQESDRDRRFGIQ